MNAKAPDAADDAFGYLIAPVSSALFHASYFERDVLHVARNDPAYFAELYSVACVEDALVLGAGDPEHFALIKNDTLTREKITSERQTVRARSMRKAPRSMIDPRSVLAAFADGNTLSITDATAYHPPLARLCNRIQTQLGWYVGANAYFTPPRAQGFGTHYDTHDTLIVQIDGTKEWRVYDPVVPLPLEMQPYSASVHDGKLGTPRTLHLAPGDSLYIPHGFPHDAVTGQTRSLHLTFALAPLRVIDLLESLLQLAASGDVELRRALPAGWQHDPAVAAQLSARLAHVMSSATSVERIPRAAHLAYNELFAATRTTAAGAFAALAAFEAIRADSRIRLRADTPFQLRDRGDRLAIVLAAKVVSVPASARPAFTRLRTGAATFAEIEAVLPPGTAHALVRTLVIEGLAVVEEPAPQRQRAGTPGHHLKVIDSQTALPRPSAVRSR